MKKILSVILFLTILYSCQKSNDDHASIPPDGNNVPNFVSLEEAVKIAEMQAPPVKGSAKAQLSELNYNKYQKTLTNFAV